MRILVRKGIDITKIYIDPLLRDLHFVENDAIVQGSIGCNRKRKRERIFNVSFFRTKVNVVSIDTIFHEEIEGCFEANTCLKAHCKGHRITVDCDNRWLTDALWIYKLKYSAERLRFKFHISMPVDTEIQIIEAIFERV
ncbi:MAG: hypothetical protein CVT71_02415 [Alphaproteobacteria bacterium HGW-Alphaproteobacteria-10]|nr:MAG: hypothetical protein CVT71_02415 [Alphaproteobacteria bacterium HGW-Alphaproteobacteria-10]